MHFGSHSHMLLMSVALQGCVDLGIAETPVHLGTVETVAVLGEYNSLYLVSLPLVLELHFHSLPFQVGNKHIPIAAPADFRFNDVVKLILRPVRLSFRRLRLTLSFPLAMCKPHFKVSSLQIQVLRNRSFLSEMVLPLLSIRLKAICTCGCSLSKCRAMKNWVSRMPIRSMYSSTIPAMTRFVKRGSSSLEKLNAILECDNLGILVLVKYIVHHTFEIASLCDFCHHTPILFMSS